MLQALLIDRFKLAVHREARDVPAYKLVLSKESRKPNEAAMRDPEFPNGTLRIAPGQIVAQAISMGRVASLLSSELHRAVSDETGLSGRYDLAIVRDPGETHVAASPEGGADQQIAPAQPEDDGVAVSMEIQKQLGLKLEPTKTSAEVIVIDRIERPSEN
jgi:uncharacterized protein (TIGR03435 family)